MEKSLEGRVKKEQAIAPFITTHPLFFLLFIEKSLEYK